MRKLLIIIGLSTLTGACVNLQHPLSTEHGKFAANNFNAQVVDPAPAEGAPQMDAAMVDAAVARYRNDEVKNAQESDANQVNVLNFTPE